MSQSRLNWTGKLVKNKAVEVLKDGLESFDRFVVREARLELYPGHGWVTGTLHRSLHGAEPDYNWSGDHVEADQNTPDRESYSFEPRVTEHAVESAVGSGQQYAMAVHQGHRSFPGYHFLTIALERSIPFAEYEFISAARKHGIRP